MNPWVGLAALILWVSSTGGAYYYGTDVGKDSEIAKQAEIKQAIADTKEQARQGAASEIAKIKIKNTTIQSKIQTEIRDNPVYVECRHSDDTMRMLNDALSGKSTESRRANSGVMSGATTTH